MYKTLKLFYSFLMLLLVACGGGDCNELPKNYSSYDEAIQKIKSADFDLEESVNTSKSSWIRGAEYYSCDGISGFLILQTDNDNYIYSGVTREIWQDFKNAESLGNFYHQRIKNKYQFKLN